jgi:hypothetical protein
VEADGATYDQMTRFYLRVIWSCESQKAALRLQLLVLTVECAVLELFSPEAAQELQALIAEIEDQIEELSRMEEAARAGLAQLRRDHGPVRRARASSPEGGAEKAHYTGAGAAT